MKRNTPLLVLLALAVAFAFVPTTSASAPLAGHMGCGRPTVTYGTCVGGRVLAAAGGGGADQESFEDAKWTETDRQMNGKRTAHADGKYGTVTSSYSYSVSPDSVTITSLVSGQGKNPVLSGGSYGSTCRWCMTPASRVSTQVMAEWTDTLTLSSRTTKGPAGGWKDAKPSDYITLAFLLTEKGLGRRNAPDCGRLGTSYTSDYAFAYTSSLVASVLTFKPSGEQNLMLGGVGVAGGIGSMNECPLDSSSGDALGLIGTPIKILIAVSALDLGSLYDGPDGTKSGRAGADRRQVGLCIRATKNAPEDLEITSASKHNYRC
jgi:hypothetical protein